MSNTKEDVDPIPNSPGMMPTPPPPPPHASAADVERQTGGGETGILRRWRREDLMKRGSLAMRGAALLFSLLSFIIMASNKHGDWKVFSNYEEYRYVLGIATLSTLYTGLQVFRQVQELSTGREILQFRQRTSLLLDFIGDQLIAYLLVSAASSAVPLTNRMRENNDNIFTDSSASSISMAFLAFITLAFSALISGYKLSTQSYM